MARRRGFVAEVQRQMRIQAQQENQRQRARERERAAANRRIEQARREQERARAAAARATAAEKKRLEREAAAAYVSSRQAEVQQLNDELVATYEELDGILAATLPVDDYVDLETFRVKVEHPPFEREDLRQPLKRPEPIPDPAWPVRGEVPKPKGLFGRKKKLAAAQRDVEIQYSADFDRWQREVASLPARREAQEREYSEAEATRVARLETALQLYKQECDSRQNEVDNLNAELDEFIAELSYGVPERVEEYISLVLTNSSYPEGFAVQHSSKFEPGSAELTMQVLIPGPAEIENVKNYRYVKSSDEITSTPLSQKAVKDRYSGIVHSVALRTLHEVFEGDRRGLIQTISLVVATETLNPATGRNEFVPLAAVAAGRETFNSLELSAVVPAATLEYLGATVSKNPSGLVPIEVDGIRAAK
jgi:restriction system protein